MTRIEALQIAIATRAAHVKADIETMFGRAPVFNALEVFGYRNGWYRVGEFSFGTDEITGKQYDHTQAGWAFI